DAIMSKIASASHPEDGSNEPPKVDYLQIYLEEVGVKKTRIYGLGSQAPFYGHVGASSSSISPLQDIDFNARVNECVEHRLQEIKEEMKHEMRPEIREEIRQEMREEMREELREEMRHEMQQEDAIMSKIASASHPEDGSNEPPKVDYLQIYLEEVGVKKTRIYGLGSQAPFYGHVGASSSSISPLQDIDFNARVNECVEHRLQEIKEEMKHEMRPEIREEIRQEMREEMREELRR
ncbi:hypothetical protein A4A49_43547, partial [Nicotiana attenuata]